jgi:hypothetical protein
MLNYATVVPKRRKAQYLSVMRSYLAHALISAQKLVHPKKGEEEKTRLSQDVTQNLIFLGSLLLHVLQV